MQTFTLGSYSIISGGNPVGNILLQTPIEGLDSPNHRTSSFARPGRDGATVSSQYYDARMIKLVGKINGTSFSDYENSRKALVAAVAISRDANLYPVPVRVSFTTLAGSSYYVDVYFDKPVMDMTSPVDCDFMITGVAPNPMIFGATAVTQSGITPPTGGGYVVPMILPYVSAAATGGSVTVNNAGTERAWPLITLTGLLKTPVVTNATNGKYLQLNYTLATGDTVVIDMFNQLITLNGSASLIGTKTLPSDWWTVDPGNNTISITTTNSGDTGSMTVGFNPPYVGV